jgi:hypothetical protein
MATRMQQRRGTAAQWISTNSGNGPILNAGEIGYETDTNKFKIGDGTNHWANLSYFSDADRTLAFTTSLTFEGATADSYETTLQVTDPTADRTITLPNASGTVALTSDIAELSQDAIDSAITAGTGITKTYDDAANTLTLAVNTATMQARVANVTDTEIGYLDGVTSAIQTQMDAKAPLASPALTGNATAVNLTLSGNLTVNGTTTTVNSTEVNIGNAFTFEGATADAFETTLTVADPTADRAINLPDASGTVALQEFVAAAATSTDGLGWNNTTKKITVDTAYIGEVAMDAVAGAISPGTGLSKVYDDTTNTITLDISSTVATKSYADTAVSTHDSDTTSVHGISNTANLVATTDTGTVTSTMILDGTIVNADINASAAIATSKISGLDTALGLKAPLADPTFTGVVTLPANTITNTMMADNSVNTAELTALSVTEAKLADGAVTSVKIANDTIVNADINSAAAIALSKLATDPLARANHTGTQSASSISDFNEAAQDAVGGILGSGLTYTDASNTITVDSSVIQLRVSGVTDTEIGYLDGVTSAVQTQLDDKLSKTGGTMTGALTLSGAPTIDLHAATKAYVDNVVSGINFHQPVRVATTANITLSGTQTIDGVSLSVGDRVLVKDQTTQTQNGIYVVAASAWSRATDADNNPTGELAGGDFCLVLEGTAGAGYGYVCSNTSTITVGTTNVTYVAFNAAKAITAGSGLTESTPGTLDIATGGVTSTMIADGTILDADINASAAIAQSKISGLSSSFALKAPLADPTFTGTVTVAAAGVAFTDGTQSKEGVPSRTPIIQKTASYTLTATTERDSLIEVASGSGTTITIPTNSAVAYPVGTSIDILQTSTGQVTIAGDAGVTVNATPGLKLRTQWSSATLFKRATNTWVVYGDLTA